MKSNYCVVLDREIHYTEWGVVDAPTIVMWHGLARTGRDFDDIAAHFAATYRVICPDTLGRGLSQWSPRPEQEYNLDYYVRSATALVDALGLGEFDWIGTSMGGAIGTVAAAGPLKGRIRPWYSTTMAPRWRLPRLSAFAVMRENLRALPGSVSWRPISALSTNPLANYPMRIGGASRRLQRGACLTGG